MICPACQKTLIQMDALYCAYCGEPIAAVPAKPNPQDARALNAIPDPERHRSLFQLWAVLQTARTSCNLSHMSINTVLKAVDICAQHLSHQNAHSLTRINDAVRSLDDCHKTLLELISTVEKLMDTPHEVPK
mgnify:CR=1 FL=1